MEIRMPRNDADTSKKSYWVKSLGNEAIVLTGQGIDERWSKAVPLSEFVYPWQDETPSCTTFKALHNHEWLYCYFFVRVKDVKVYRIADKKSEIIKSDRVEIFFKKDDRLSPYYCLEVDPLARVYDYEARYHRQFNTDWSWPKGQLLVKASRSNTGYSVEMAIHKDSLTALGILQNNVIAAGLYRAECVSIQGSTSTMKWISWIMPDSATPDFHIPSSFGLLKLED